MIRNQESNTLPGWMRLLFAPYTYAILISLAAFLTMALIESLRDPGTWLRFQGRFLVYLILAPVYALLIGAVQFVTRFLSSIASHTGWLERMLLPAILLMVAVGEPAFSLIPALSSNPIAGRFFVALVAMGVALIPLLVLIRFHGVNLWSLLVALSLSRVLLLPLNFDPGFDSFFTVTAVVMITALPIYGLLHSRMRWLVLNYDPRPPESGVILFIAVWCGLSVTLFIFQRSPLFMTGDSIKFPLDLKLWSSAPLVLFSFHWLFQTLLVRLTASQKNTHEGKHPFLQYGTLAIALMATLVVAAAMFNRTAMDSMRYAAFQGGLAKELLMGGAILTDRDGDGNSVWPGTDPNDSDPCERRDWSRECNTRFLSGDLSPSFWSRDGDKRSDTLLPDELMILTLSGVNPEAVNRSLMDYRTRDSREFRLFREQRFLMPSDSIPLTLQSLIHGVDGVDENRGATGETLFSALSMSHYRTVCVVQDDINSSRSDGIHLGSGCQIHVPNLIQKEQVDPPDFAHYSLSAYHLYLRFKEKNRNAFWLHYQGDHETDADAVANFIIHRKSGNLHILFLDPHLPRVVHYWYESENGSAMILPESYGSNSSVSEPARMGVVEKRTGVEPWILQMFRKSFGVNLKSGRITYRQIHGGIEYFDPLLGYSWVEMAKGGEDRVE